MKRLVVGIDYGTSNSGVAYALFDDDDGLRPDHIRIAVIKDLARGPSGQDSSEKLPSDIAYDDHWQPVGQAFNIPTNAIALQWVKLLLEPNGLRGKRGTQRLWKTYDALGNHKLPVEVVADYLKWLWIRAKASIINKLDDSEVFEKSDLTVVLTIPAFWSERAKQSMLKAAEAAGITQEAQAIRLVPEAEAAAIYGLDWQAQHTSVREQDCVIVCDAGGGTVDLVSYQLLSRHPLLIDQRTTPKGAFCGSVFIDLEFENQMRSILGDAFDALDSQAKSRIEEKFEYEIKRTYSQDSQASSRYSIPLPENQEQSVEANVIEQCFQAIMTPIETLIDDQIDQLREKDLEDKIKGILLVGGLSRSDYVYNRIHDGYGSQTMKVWRADDAWTAVAQGAVFCETSTVIHSRLSKHNYGIPYRDDNGNRMIHWIVKKNQSVQSNMPTAPFALRIDDKPWLDQDQYFHLYVTLVRSDQEDPTEHFDAQSVRPHAVIDCRLPTAIRSSEKATLVQKNPKAWHIPATFVPILNGAVILFRCKIEHEEVGVTELKYFDDEGSPDQDFHPDPNAISITRAPTRTGTGDSAKDFRLLPVTSHSAQSRPRKIRDYHFNTRVARDAPPGERPRAGTLPGLFVRGWIPRDDFYVDN